MSMNNEIWKTIEEYPDYQVSNLGRVKSLKFNKEKILKQCKNKDGYFRVDLYRNKKQYHKLIHHLVYETFNNYKLKNNECIHHKDENKENNNINNFKLMNKSNHVSLHHKGENNQNFGKNRSNEIKNKISISHKNNNLKDENKIKKIIEIKLLLDENKLSCRKIAKMTGFSHQMISKIKSGKQWSYIEII